MPEPWATRLVSEGGGKILVDEASLWPKGQYVTTQLIVTTGFLKDHPDVVQQLVNGQVAANDYIKTNTADAESLVSAGIQQITGKPIDGNLVIASFKNISFTNDPISSSFVKDNKSQKALGFPAADSLKGIYDLSFLNKALKAAGEPTHPRSEDVTTAVPVRAPESTSASPLAEVDSARAIVLDHVSKVYGDASNAVHALDNVSLTVARGEFVCLLGASGCGKSTLLNIVAGLDRPSVGVVDVGEARTTLMFQEAALFPWLTARGNVEIALKLRKVPRTERGPKVDSLLDLVNLRTFGKKRPHELSGGMRAACRAGPSARAGGRHPAHGRAIRCARRHDP